MVHGIAVPNQEHKAKISAAKKGKLLGKYPEERAKKQRGKRPTKKILKNLNFLPLIEFCHGTEIAICMLVDNVSNKFRTQTT